MSEATMADVREEHLESARDKVDAAYNRAYEMGHEELASDDEMRAAHWFFLAADLREALRALSRARPETDGSTPR